MNVSRINMNTKVHTTFKNNTVESAVALLTKKESIDFLNEHRGLAETIIHLGKNLEKHKQQEDKELEVYRQAIEYYAKNHINYVIHDSGRILGSF